MVEKEEKEKEEVVSQLFDMISSKLRVYTAEMAAYMTGSVHQLAQPCLLSICVEAPNRDIAIELYRGFVRIAKMFPYSFCCLKILRADRFLIIAETGNNVCPMECPVDDRWWSD